MKKKILSIILTLCFILSSCSQAYDSGKYEKVRVEKVVDGDTLKIQTKDDTYKLRLIGVNTPETVHPNKNVEFFGKEASNFTKNKLTGKTIYLEKDVSNTDRYHRLLRYVWLEIPSDNPTEEEITDKMFNAILVKEGYAYSSPYPPDIKHQDIFDKLQKTAEENNIGLWNQESRDDFEDKNTEKEEKKKEVPDNEESKETSSDENNSDAIGITSTKEVKSGKNTYTADTTPNVIKGNIKSKVYHSPGQRDYNKISVDNVVHFSSKEEAEKAGYRPAQR